MSLSKLAAGLSALFLSVAPALGADKVTFQLDWLPGGDKAPIYVCIHHGFCGDAGLDVTIASGRGSTEAISRLAAGSSDIGVSDLAALMSARANENVKVTAVMSLFNKGPHAFYVIKGGKISSIKDVKGKTIATSPFTSSNLYLPLVLKAVGIEPSDVKLIKADPGALGPMLVTGNADGIIAWMTDFTRYSNQARQAGKEIVALPWSAAGLNLYSASLIASDSFLQNRPDVAKRFVAAYRKSVEYTKDHPKEAAADVVAMVKELGSEDVEGSVKDTLPLMFNEVTAKDGFGVFEPGRLAETWKQVAAAQGIDPAKLDPETAVNRNFLPKE
ncbi:ABC transporter substrate-binding protein [Allorhizobium sp. BGMRC 0089]|uniref:ABC transporter substrate-binding protein n=1 Tax=Allorhizobium sonneratiae TaxID=2934936 RepID=UPI0020333C9E|nr:ABC transporter substrate-binding protein [Allorhizobium sonneratiae]MCM2292472.1 ABC transporter substrate-binding protein [Allorhizobium sonneratiae]